MWTNLRPENLEELVEFLRKTNAADYEGVAALLGTYGSGKLHATRMLYGRIIQWEGVFRIYDTDITMSTLLVGEPGSHRVFETKYHVGKTLVEVKEKE